MIGGLMPVCRVRYSYPGHSRIHPIRAVQEAWLPTCILMWVPQQGREEGVHDFHKFWLVPRPELPEKIDVLLSTQSVQLCRYPYL